MSFILDALKKSEAERQRQAGPALLEMRVVRPRRRWPMWALTGGVLLVLSNVVLLIWVLLRTPSPPPPATATAATPGPAPSPPTSAPPLATAPSLPPAPITAAPDTAAPGFNAGESANPNPADLLPAAPPVTAYSTQGLQNYAQLSGSLPPLRLDLHAYAARPADRYAFINMRKVTEGVTTAEGMRVLEITPEGVVLSYRDTEFVLGRE